MINLLWDLYQVKKIKNFQSSLEKSNAYCSMNTTFFFFFGKDLKVRLEFSLLQSISLDREINCLSISW